jgi:phosphatidylethanolamine-binding protein (PEBP) family uncharacterized protein
VGAGTVFALCRPDETLRAAIVRTRIQARTTSAILSFNLATLLEAMKGHILEQVELVGTYQKS